MLGYILSKMQMLIFAAGILFVGILFLGFISSLELKTAADNLLLTTSSGIISVLSAEEGLSYSKTLSIPDRITYGVNGSSQLFYDLNFSWLTVGDKNELILSVNEHGKKNILSARKVSMNDAIVLIGPSFLAEDESIAKEYDKQEITLYPRAANKGTQASAPNSFVILREIKGGTGTVYIIPCTTLRQETPNNCIKNVLQLGCYQLSLTSPQNDASIASAFDVTREINESGTQLRGMTWAQCKQMFPFFAS